jgi:hypothetical protein
MKVEVSDPVLAEDLIEALRRSGCIAIRSGGRTIDVRFGWPLRDDAARHQLDGYLRVWEASRRGAWAVRVG